MAGLARDIKPAGRFDPFGIQHGWLNLRRWFPTVNCWIVPRMILT
jgi:hypothetical protein